MKRRSEKRQRPSSPPNPLYRSDPITYFFRSVLRLGPIVSTLLCWGLGSLVVILAVLNNGEIYISGTRRGLLEDLGWWNFQGWIFPLCIYSFFRLPDRIMQVFSELKENGILAGEPRRRAASQWEKFLAHFRKNYLHWGSNALSVIYQYLRQR